MSALSMFQSNLREALKILARGSFASTAERDEILRALVEGASKLRARDVVWMLFKPDRAIRTAGATILRQHASPDILEAFLSQARGKPEAAIRAASGLLFQLEIPDPARFHSFDGDGVGQSFTLGKPVACARFILIECFCCLDDNALP